MFDGAVFFIKQDSVRQAVYVQALRRLAAFIQSGDGKPVLFGRFGYGFGVVIHKYGYDFNLISVFFFGRHDRGQQGVHVYRVSL